MAMPLVQFAPLSSLVHPGLWHALADLKLDVLRLSDAAVPLFAAYSPGRSVLDRETGRDIALAASLVLAEDAFSPAYTPPTNSIAIRGTLKNYNSIEEFKAAEKAALFNAEADAIWKHIHTTRDTSALTRFLLITYADLKKHKFYYWFAFPALVASPAWVIDDPRGWSSASDHLTHDQLLLIQSQLKSRPSLLAFFLLRAPAGAAEIAPVEEYATFFAQTPQDQQTIAFLDPSANPHNPGWPLRNLLAYLRALHPASTSSLRILCWRDTDPPSSPSGWKSRVGLIHVGPAATDTSTQHAADARPSAVGWEKNTQGKLGPRLADLAPMMDPTLLANQAVDLNLKLMRWRILPALDLPKIAATRCLLLGAGTLGCYVARTLMAWGVRTITFVDSARVSFSNPVRQPLFEFEDCLEGGRPKAECAADRLAKIFPGINATGHMLSIPMPGHPISSSNPAVVAQVRADVAKIEELVDTHDALFLLMDSRESRWLPTVMGAAKNKIVINAALGFDTFLVMRHGPHASTIPPSSTTPRLGCYYCNDIVAPKDSLSDRTLDQMCTVTRPGLAPIAAATAVELLVSLVQHPDGIFAPPPVPDSATANPDLTMGSGRASSILGHVPHQLRGFLSQFRTLPLIGAAYDRCTGCSEAIVRAYQEGGFEVVRRACDEDGYLEKVTGLDQLADESEAVLGSVDWVEEDEEEGEI